ncbi:MAG: c-type cytochrome [Armatimonadetes bacterium]|nr:c-type cytochrome [Armatimonadota bacterium]
MTAVSILVVLGAVVFSSRSSQKQEIERGRYLTHSLAMCVDCHGEGLTGARLPFKPTVHIPNWRNTAPPLNAKSLKRFGVDGLARLFTTGRTPDGKTLGPPMPQFHMHASDAHAIAAYLTSRK